MNQVRRQELYRHSGHLLERSLPPCAIDEALLATLQFLRVLQIRRCSIHHPTGQLKQARRPVKRDATVVFDIETVKLSSEVLCIGIRLYLRSA